MTHELRLLLLGRPQLLLGEVVLTVQMPVKAQAMLYYLATTGDSQSRQILATLLWGETSDEKARRSLRVALTKMRQSLDTHLIVNRQSLAFDQESPYWLDVEAFEYFLRRDTGSDGAAERARLREAVALYRGEFLEGIDVGDAPIYEEWILPQRERLRQMALEALDRLVDICTEQGDYEAGIGHARRLLALDSWREEAHRQLMWLLALSGKRSPALVQYETCRDVLMRELGVEPTEETLALYHRIRDMEEGQAGRPTRPLPPLPGKTDDESVPFQAPSPAPYFVGRDEELEHCSTLLTQAGEQRVYSLVGMGGIGKTALAIHLAHAVRDAFPDGVLWANAATSDPMAIAESWAGAYGYDFSGVPDIESRAAALRRMLVEKQTLLLFDDVMSAARMRPFLPGGDQCAVLITTRNADLAYALNAQPMNLRELTPENGRLLLTSIIGPKRVTAEPTSAHEICQLLQNLPLAVTIAAQRLASRPRRKLADFAGRLRDETERLDLELRDRAVRASFAISWDGLDETQRHIFRLLAVFAGRAFTAEALAAVAEMDRYPAQDRLDELVGLSLLNEEGERHYRQHPLLADFAHEHLGQDEAPYRRMVHYFQVYATDHQRDYAALRPEWENLSAGIKTAHQMQMWQTVINYTGVLREAWFARGRFTEARQALQWARQAAETLTDKTHLAAILLHWGFACIEQNDYAEARELLSASRQCYQELDDQAGVATTQDYLARIATEQAHYVEAEQLLTENQRIRDAVGDLHGIASTNYRRASLRYYRGDYETAMRLAKQALNVQETIRDERGAIRTLRFLARTIMQSSGEVNEAEKHCQYALQLCEKIQDQGELAAILLTLSSIRIKQGNLEQARDLAEQSLKLRHNLGDRQGKSMVFFQLGRIHYEIGAFEAALESSSQSLAICRELKDEPGIAYVLQQLGDSLDQLGQREHAHKTWSQALDVSQKLEHPQLIRSLGERLDM